MKFLKNRIFWVGVVLLTIVAGVAWWMSSHSNSSEARYKTHIIERGDISQNVSANGTLNPVILVSVGTQVSGTVKKLLVDFNDRVDKGQVLAELEDVLLSSQLAQSTATLKSSQASLELAVANEKRMQSLFAQEYASRQDLDAAIQARKSAQAQVEQSTAQTQKDRANLGYSVIRSPVSGVVVDRQVDIGQTVAASFQTPTLFKIAQDLSKMQINTSFAEADIKVGQPVRFSVDAFPNRNFEGSVKQIRLNPTTTQNVVTYNVVVAVDNLDQTLLPGMTAYVNILVAQSKNVIFLPNAALRFKPSDLKATADDAKSSGSNNRPRKKRDAGTATVYVLENGKPQPVNISVGITDNRNTEVTTVSSGNLKPGTIVIVGENLPATDSAPGNVPRMRMF
jgi:HlyD family secretion protein